MATLPLYRNQTGITRLTGISTGGNIPRVADTSAIGNGLQRFGAGLQDYAEARQDVQNATDKAIMDANEIWRNAQNEAETLNADRAVQTGTLGVLTEAQDYTGYQTGKDIEAAQKKSDAALKRVYDEAAAGFTSESAKQAFLEKNALARQTTQNKLNAIYRHDYIDLTHANLVKSEDENRALFVDTGNDAYKAAYKNDLETAFSGGFISREQMQKGILGIDGWNKSRMIRRASEEPDVVMDEIQKGETAADEDVLKVIERQRKILKTQKEIDDFNTRKSVDEMIGRLPMASALTLLERNKEAFGEKLYKAKREAILSAHGINAVTQAEEHARILLEIDNLPKGGEDEDEDPVRYFGAAKKLEEEIDRLHAKGKLSEDSTKKLTSLLYKEKSKNVVMLEKSEHGDKWFGLAGFSYKDANDYISENYSGPMANNIFLDFFDQTFGEFDKMDTEKKKAVLQSMIDKRMNENFVAVTKKAQAKYKSVNGYPSFASVEEAKKAFDDGDIRKGDKVYINGRFGRI